MIIINNLQKQSNQSKMSQNLNTKIQLSDFVLILQFLQIFKMFKECTSFGYNNHEVYNLINNIGLYFHADPNVTLDVVTNCLTKLSEYSEDLTFVVFPLIPSDFKKHISDALCIIAQIKSTLSYDIETLLSFDFLMVPSEFAFEPRGKNYNFVIVTYSYLIFVDDIKFKNIFDKIKCICTNPDAEDMICDIDKFYDDENFDLIEKLKKLRDIVNECDNDFPPLPYENKIDAINDINYALKIATNIQFKKILQKLDTMNNPTASNQLMNSIDAIFNCICNNQNINDVISKLCELRDFINNDVDNFMFGQYERKNDVIDDIEIALGLL
jgi:hypothetical protein